MPPAAAQRGDARAGVPRAARQAVETDRLLGLTDVWVRAVSPPETAARELGTVVAAALPGGRTVVELPGGRTAAERLGALRAIHDAQCPHCTTATGHTQTVFGEGNPSARLVFVGEAPGETEDQLGRPFVGRAGQKLDEMIRAMGLSRDDVYIANVLKSRPPDNRTPLPTEVERCAPYLAAQLRIIRPEAIVSLGGPATKFLLGVDTGITKLRGQWASWTPPGDAGATPIPVMPTYHPAYLLRNYTPKTRSEVWSDLKQVMDCLRRQG